jgi:hypothetical protein
MQYDSMCGGGIIDTFGNALQYPPNLCLIAGQT